MEQPETPNQQDARIDPVKLSKNSSFVFECHKKVKCFTRCCRGITIVLTPYDIIRLKNRMQITSDEFLTVYTKPELLEKTDLPVVTLKLLDDEQKSCPFVREDGCLVYTDRPSSCRYYPLGVASLSHKEAGGDDGFYFFVHESHCLGFEEKKQWTVAQWRKDQGVDIHDEINAEWTDLVVRKRSFPKNVMLTPDAKKMFFLASYNIDKFKSFVFNSTFLERYEIDPETVAEIENDEIALLKFGLRWIKFLLFKDGDFQLRGAAK